eukprot:scaffold314131_cov37-Prasinocladus_malaysianus.AAC.2
MDATGGGRHEPWADRSDSQKPPGDGGGTPAEAPITTGKPRLRPSDESIPPSNDCGYVTQTNPSHERDTWATSVGIGCVGPPANRVITSESASCL